MKNMILSACVMLVSGLLLASTGHGARDGAVARLDGSTITVGVLAGYVQEVAGDQYEPLLKSDEGLRTLADSYIDRTLLLAHAKQTVNREDALLRNHNARSVDENTMCLTALLQSEVQDKVQVAFEDVLDYMKQNGTASEGQARQQLESMQRAELMKALVARVRRGHDIQYLD